MTPLLVAHDPGTESLILLGLAHVITQVAVGFCLPPENGSPHAGYELGQFPPRTTATAGLEHIGQILGRLPIFRELRRRGLVK